jgi:prepilin peptidase CpaA
MTTEFLLISLVTLAALTDLRWRRIPNLLVGAGLLAALIAQGLLPEGAGWSSWLLGMLTGFALFLPLYLLRGMAAGDVKLMAAVGAFVGPLAAFQIALATFVIGGVMALAFMICKGRLRDCWLNLRALITPLLMRIAGMPARATGMPKDSVGRMPYAVAIAFGTLAVLFFGRG